MEKTLASSQSLTVFVLELVSSGYFGDDIGPSFRTEGRAMLDAVVADLRRIPDVRVETLIDKAAEDIHGALLQCAAKIEADATFIIAPEFDGLLEQFCEAVRRPGVLSLNSEPEALSICGDKWRFAQHLTTRGLSTIPTELLDIANRPQKYPCLVKPRHGAGSWLVRLVHDQQAWPAVVEEYQQAGLSEFLCQPGIVGRALSVAALVRTGCPPELLPMAEQRLSADGEFRYLGGELPAKLPADGEKSIRQLVKSVIESLPGLHGYIGCDVIVPEDHPDEPVLVELNPRLTTSYIGYRELCEDNLMERLLFPARSGQPLRWRRGAISFDANGTCRYADP